MLLSSRSMANNYLFCFYHIIQIKSIQKLKIVFMSKLCEPTTSNDKQTLSIMLFMGGIASGGRIQRLPKWSEILFLD